MTQDWLDPNQNQAFKCRIDFSNLTNSTYLQSQVSYNGEVWNLTEIDETGTVSTIDLNTTHSG